MFLVAPSSSAERIKLITAACGGFVYAASVMGTTGTRDAVLLVNLSGRGDKDVDIAARYFGHVTG